MIPESIWSGMFQAEAGRGNTATVRSTRDAISDTVASYVISDEQGARKKVLEKGSGQLAMNRSKQGGMAIKTIVVLLVGLALASVRPVSLNASDDVDWSATFGFAPTSVKEEVLEPLAGVEPTTY